MRNLYRTVTVKLCHLAYRVLPGRIRGGQNGSSRRHRQELTGMQDRQDAQEREVSEMRRRVSALKLEIEMRERRRHGHC